MHSPEYEQIIQLVDQLGSEEQESLMHYLEDKWQRQRLSHEEYRARIASQMAKNPWLKQWTAPPDEAAQE